MSSRNSRLNQSELLKALAISKALFFVKENWGNYEINKLLVEAHNIIQSDTNLKIEYFEICNKITLEKLSGHSNQYDDAVVVTAVFCGDVRLIDNLIVYK
jgi:pantoate--beta-alanine ligase